MKLQKSWQMELEMVSNSSGSEAFDGRYARLTWSSGQHFQTTSVREIYIFVLANKEAAKWRVSLGDSGILNFFLGISITNTLRHSFKLQILRLIGNSCADTGMSITSILLTRL
jgi:hypothetical protein